MMGSDVKHKLALKADEWNKKHSPGETITLSDGRISTTTTIAYLDYHGRPVIHVHGIKGCVPLEMIR